MDGGDATDAVVGWARLTDLVCCWHSESSRSKAGITAVIDLLAGVGEVFRNCSLDRTIAELR